MRRKRRPHGDGWIYIAAPHLSPADAAAVLARLEAIAPYQDRKPRKPETIAAYAARQARRLGLAPVGTGGDDWQRLPDDVETDEKAAA